MTKEKAAVKKPEPRTYYDATEVWNYLFFEHGIKGDTQDALAAVNYGELSNGEVVYFDEQSLDRLRSSRHLPYLRAILEHFGPEVRIRYSW